MPYFFYQGKRCFYTCSGVGPPLLFLHGNTASSQMFQFLLPFYTPCFHCILLDFLGSGRSQRMPELPPQLWIDQGRQAAALIRHLGLGPVFLVGTSGGAWAALNAGLEHPDLVRGIVADSFDGRTLHRGFDRELLEERAAAKARRGRIDERDPLQSTAARRHRAEKAAKMHRQQHAHRRDPGKKPPIRLCPDQHQAPHLPAALKMELL